MCFRQQQFIVYSVTHHTTKPLEYRSTALIISTYSPWWLLGGPAFCDTKEGQWLCKITGFAFRGNSRFFFLFLPKPLVPSQSEDSRINVSWITSIISWFWLSLRLWCLLALSSDECFVAEANEWKNFWQTNWTYAWCIHICLQLMSFSFTFRTGQNIPVGLFHWDFWISWQWLRVPLHLILMGLFYWWVDS